MHEFCEWWRGVAALDERSELEPRAMNQALREWVRQWTAPTWGQQLEDDAWDTLRVLYDRWRDRSIDRHRLLTILALVPSEVSWRMLAELIASDPPERVEESIEALGPLWKFTQGPFSALFPRILAAVASPSVAAIVLDLANYWTRARRLPAHPALAQAESWTQLLGDLIDRLETFAEVSSAQGVTDLDVAAQVQETITLTISLVDTLSLLDHYPAAAKLHRLLQLDHRRLRAEAAATLTRWDDPAGLPVLQALASEPLMRLRVIRYAEELGVVDQLPQEARTPVALATSQLVMRLAEPDLVGFPPTRCELVEQRTLYWPGYDEPQECFLFRYRYGGEEEGWENFAIAGPFCYALAADLTSLPIPWVLAAYAGVSFEHPDVELVALEQLDAGLRVKLQRIVQQFTDEGCSQVMAEFAGTVFGEWTFVIRLRRGEQQALAIVNAQGQSVGFPVRPVARPLDPETVFALYVGGLVLREFNDDFELPPLRA